MTERQDLAYWLALLRAPGIGAASFLALLEQGATPRDVFEGRYRQRVFPTLEDDLERYLQKPDWAAVEADLGWAEQEQRHIVTFQDPRYPPLLKETVNPPPMLFIHGDPALLLSPQLAMVGSRNPTASGRETAQEFARHLSLAGLSITSGLALGIDAASHEGALAGGGKTIAVTGTGLDRVYPARHRELAHRIAQTGALVSEFPLGTPPRPEHFPQRNRVISGMSLGTLVVEAAVGSGSLITARFAVEQGREVFAIPGSIHSPLARGCHALIRDGAKLVETAQDVLEELNPLTGFVYSMGSPLEMTADRHNLDKRYTNFLDQLGFEPTAVDILIERSGLTPEEVSSMLLELELQGHVAAMPGGLYTRFKRGV